MVALLSLARRAGARPGFDRRQNKNADRLRKRLAHLLGALPVDFQQDVPSDTLLAQPAQRGCRTVIAIHPAYSRKSLTGDHRLRKVHTRSTNDSAHCTSPARLARGVRHRQLRNLCRRPAGGHQRSSVAPDGAGDDENVSGFVWREFLDNHRGNRSGSKFAPELTMTKPPRTYPWRHAVAWSISSQIGAVLPGVFFANAA